VYTSFTAKVYAIVAQIPAGKVATYGDIAQIIGNPLAARAVGMALSRNLNTHQVPCHRVVGSDGSLRGYAFGGILAKSRLLQQEGVPIRNGKVDLKKSRWHSAANVY
jgi:methylated-DNA-protein-cysteine methyltransferase-like protein